MAVDSYGGEMNWTATPNATSGSGSGSQPVNTSNVIPSLNISAGCYLQVTTYGDLVVLGASGATLWSANAGSPPPPTTTCVPNPAMLNYPYTDNDCYTIKSLIDASRAYINDLAVTELYICNAPVGKYCPGGTGDPIPCTAAPGNYCPVGSTTPAGVQCPVGSYCTGGSSNAIVCTAGYKCPAGAGFQTPCSAGSYCPVGTGTQIPCTTPGYFCPDGVAAEIPCTAPAGNYCAAGSLRSSGQQCPAGYYCTGGSANAVACTAGNYCPTGAAAQTPCAAPAGNYCPAGSITAAGTACPANTYCPGGPTTPTKYTCPSPTSPPTGGDLRQFWFVQSNPDYQNCYVYQYECSDPTIPMDIINGVVKCSLGIPGFLSQWVNATAVNQYLKLGGFGGIRNATATPLY